MGAAPSVPISSRSGIKEELVDDSSTQEIAQCMPEFYVPNAEITEVDQNRVRDSWQVICDDLASEYLSKKENPDFEYANCLVWFASVFYDHLFELHPEIRIFFKGNILFQGRKLVKMISTCIELMDKNPSALIENITGLAKMHITLGVSPHEFAYVVENIIWTLELCLGSVFSGNIRDAWYKVLSRICRLMAIAAVKEENNQKLVREAHRTDDGISVGDDHEKNLNSITSPRIAT